MMNLYSIEGMLLFVAIIVTLYGMGVYRQVKEDSQEDEKNPQLSADENCLRLAHYLQTPANRRAPVTLFGMQGKSFAVIDLTHPQSNAFSFSHAQKKYAVTQT